MADELISRQAILEEIDKSKYHRQERDVMRYALSHIPAVDAVVLPCKVGDAMYMEIGDDETPHVVDTGKVFAIGIDESDTIWISVRYECGLKFYHPSDDIGKTAFRTREEAEEVLKRREENA